MPEDAMILTIVMMTVVVGFIATLLAEPHDVPPFPVWNDELERRLLRERKIDRGW
ncbi:MAG: hypothetical protein NVS2B17_20960 [Candidatus Velthaea sp.]